MKNVTCYISLFLVLVGVHSMSAVNVQEIFDRYFPKETENARIVLDSKGGFSRISSFVLEKRPLTTIDISGVGVSDIESMLRLADSLVSDEQQSTEKLKKMVIEICMNHGQGGLEEVNNFFEKLISMANLLRQEVVIQTFETLNQEQAFFEELRTVLEPELRHINRIADERTSPTGMRYARFMQQQRLSDFHEWQQEEQTEYFEGARVEQFCPHFAPPKKVSGARIQVPPIPSSEVSRSLMFFGRGSLGKKCSIQ